MPPSLNPAWPGVNTPINLAQQFFPQETLGNEFSVLRHVSFSLSPLPQLMLMLMLSPISDFLNSLDDSSIWGSEQQSTVAPSMMSAPPFSDSAPAPSPALPVDAATPYGPSSDPQHSANADANQGPAPDKPPEEAAPVVLPAATKTERFFLTAADQASGSRNERLNMVIRSKYEAGLLKPYNYVKGYARLSRWMDKK